MAKFDFEGARKAGYSDQEISSYLAESNPEFDVKGAIQSGYSPEEVSKYLTVLASEKAQPSRAKSLIAAPLKGLLKSIENINPFQPPGPIGGEKFISRMLPTQAKRPEQVLERAGALAPAIALGPEGLLEKGIQLGTGTIAGYLAEQEGAGQIGQAAAEVIGASFPNLLKSIGAKALGAVKKGFAKTGGEATAKATSLKPSEINEALRQSAERLGVLPEVPLSAQVSNPKIQAVETRLMQSVTGGPIQEKIERAGQKLTDTYKDVAKSISTRENLLPSAISSEAVNSLKGIEEGAEKAYRSLYSQASKLLPQEAATIPKVGAAIHNIIDKTIEKLQSALGTPSKDALVNRLTRLKNTWSATPELRAGSIPIRDLEVLKQDLNQVIKYETKGGVDKLLTPLQAVTKEGIQSYGRKFNNPYLNRFNQAERSFAENARTFRKNRAMKALVKGESSEQIFGKMNTVKGINELERVFSKSQDGIEAFDALKRYKLEDILNKKVLDKNGNISWGKSAGMLKDPKTRDLVLKLVGPEHYKKLKDLSVVASGVEEGFKKFLNTSKTASTAIDMALLVGLPVKAVQQLFSGNVLGATKTAAAIFAPNQLAKLMANPEFVEAAINTAKAGKGTNPSLFMQNAQRVAQLTAAEMVQPLALENEP